MTNAISWNLQVSIKDGHLDDFEALMHEMVESTEAEAGALIYEWFLSDDRQSCHLYERYADADAVMTHLGNFGAKFAERFLGHVEPTSMLVYGEPSDAARTALAGFGGVFFSTFGGFCK